MCLANKKSWIKNGIWNCWITMITICLDSMSTFWNNFTHLNMFKLWVAAHNFKWVLISIVYCGCLACLGVIGVFYTHIGSWNFFVAVQVIVREIYILTQNLTNDKPWLCTAAIFFICYIVRPWTVLKLPSPGIEPPTLPSWCLIATIEPKSQLNNQSSNHSSPPYTHTAT